MTPESVGPLTRPFPIGRITPEGGVTADVEATEAERAALAADLGLPAIHALRGRFRLSSLGERIQVTGVITAEVEQTCVVTLDPFRSRVDEKVAVDFTTPDPRRPAPDPEAWLTPDHDPPDELTGTTLDLGAITAEFLALGLDPYPRKPGVEFQSPDEPATASPFAALARLKNGDS